MYRLLQLIAIVVSAFHWDSELEGTLETVLPYFLNLQPELMIFATFSVPDSGLALETKRLLGYCPYPRVLLVW